MPQSKNFFASANELTVTPGVIELYSLPQCGEQVQKRVKRISNVTEFVVGRHRGARANPSE